MKGLVEGYEEWKSGGGKVGGLSGSSNVSTRHQRVHPGGTTVSCAELTRKQVYFALKYGLKPMGTIAHEWIMAIGAVQGYKGSNGRAMDMWEEGISEVRPETQLILAVYPRGPDAPPLTMLTDTFTAQAFFVDFRADPTRALRWGTLRQDSGDPFEFVREAKKAWADVEDKAGVTREDGVVAKGKRVIFSDGLDVEKAVALQKGCDELKIGGESPQSEATRSRVTNASSQPPSGSALSSQMTSRTPRTQQKSPNR